TIPPPPTSTLFPYTTLFRSDRQRLPSDAGPQRRHAREMNEHERDGARIDDIVVRASGVGGAIGASALGASALCASALGASRLMRSEEHTSELQSRENLVCRL